MAKYRAQEDEEVPEMDDVIEYSQNDLSGGVFSSWTPQKKAIFLVVGIIALLLVIGLVWVGVTVFTTRDYYASIQESASGDELRRELQTLLRSTGQVGLFIFEEFHKSIADGPPLVQCVHVLCSCFL
tara:strand:- start:183 stop:563 length:381 start_codon:yes stop_codon:yes gene_type:complete